MTQPQHIPSSVSAGEQEREDPRVERIAQAIYEGNPVWSQVGWGEFAWPDCWPHSWSAEADDFRAMARAVLAALDAEAGGEPVSSVVTVVGAVRHVPYGEVVWPDEDQWFWEANVYIGGQGPRSFDIGWQIIDRLTSLGEYVDADCPSRCASLRFGNCVHVRLHKKHDRAFWRKRDIHV